MHCEPNRKEHLWMPACNDGSIVTQDNPLFSVSSNLSLQACLWNFSLHFNLFFFWSELLGSIKDPDWDTGGCCKRPRHRNPSCQCKHDFWNMAGFVRSSKKIWFLVQLFTKVLWTELFESSEHHIFTCSFWSHCQDPGCLMYPEDSVPYPHPWGHGPRRWWRSPGKWGGGAGGGRRSRRSPRCGRKSGTLLGRPTLSCWPVACKQNK